jgi:hypothetical protein
MTADGMGDRYPQRTMSVAEARAALERLRDSSGSVPKHHPAPRRFINDLHAALIPIATVKQQTLYRMDNAVDAPMGYLHNRVVEVLANFDTLLAERIHEQAERQAPG